MLLDKVGLPHLLTIPAAGALCFVAGFAFGIPALRLRGLYLALVTLGLAIAVPPLIKKSEGLTGGTQGLTVEQPAATLGLAQDQVVYFVTLAVAVLMFVLARNLVRGDIGRAMVAVRENEIAARTMGVDLAHVKTRTFAFSSMYAGVAGALYVLSIGFVAPEAFGLVVSFSFLAAIAVGGLGTISGAVFGALFIQFVPQYAGEVDEALTGVIYGAALMLTMYLLRGGVAGLLGRLGRRIVVVRDAPAPAVALARGPGAPARAGARRINPRRG